MVTVIKFFGRVLAHIFMGTLTGGIFGIIGVVIISRGEALLSPDILALAALVGGIYGAFFAVLFSFFALPLLKERGLFYSLMWLNTATSVGYIMSLFLFLNSRYEMSGILITSGAGYWLGVMGCHFFPEKADAMT